jgi:hypothetical protein
VTPADVVTDGSILNAAGDAMSSLIF